MKIEINLGFSHIRDSIRAIDAKLKATGPVLDDAQRISLTHLRNSLMEALPADMRKLVERS